jgi:SAM-dependent methyltransferase
MTQQEYIKATPQLRTHAEITEYLLSFDLFKGNEYEGYAYVKDALNRFLIAIQMIPPATQPGAKLLELGANPYFISLLLKKFHRYEWHGANYFGAGETRPVAEQTIHSERYGETHTFQYAHFNVEFDDYPYADATFEVVLFCEILEHLTVNPTHTLNEIHRVLKPGGHVLITTPNMLRWEHLAQLARGQNINDPYSGYGVYGRHNREYAPQEVIRLLEDCGFAVQQVRLENIHTPPLPQQVLTQVRKHWKEHIFALARAERPRRSAYEPWLYRSLVGLRRVTSDVVTMGQNDELHTGLGWYPLERLHEPVRWTQQSAEIFLRAKGGEDTIVAEVNASANILGPVQLTLRSNNAEQHYTLDGNDWTSVALAIPPCDPGAEVHVVLEVDRLRCPATLGVNQDQRQLGVMVHSVALRRQSDDQAA